MTISSHRNLAIILGLILAGLVSLFSLIGLDINHVDFYKYIIVEFLSVFLVAYILIYFAVRGLIDKKIKPIYKIINAGNKTGTEFYKDLEDKNLVSEVEREVAIWAGKKVREIDQLKKMEKYRKEFLGNVSHELKTPIFNIQGYILTLLDGGLEDVTINRKYLERTEKSVNRLISIVEDLEKISRLESGQLELQYENFNILDLVKEVFELQEMRARNKNIKFCLLSNEKAVMVNADRKKILDVLANLIINSINYGQENGKTTVEIFDMDNQILVEVSDTGIGIAEKHLSRLFERFYRVDKSRSSNEGGTGLGLAIVKHIIEAHDQHVSVRSNEGKGSSFGFTLSKSKPTQK